MTGAAKNDQTKPDMSLIPRIFLEQVSHAFCVGERKYGRYNYCKGHKSSQLVAAAIRHITAWNEGEECDPVDGQHHLGAAGANLAMLLRQQQLETLKDDRYIGNKEVHGVLKSEHLSLEIQAELKKEALKEFRPEEIHIHSDYYTCFCGHNTGTIPCSYCSRNKK